MGWLRRGRLAIGSTGSCAPGSWAVTLVAHPPQAQHRGAVLVSQVSQGFRNQGTSNNRSDCFTKPKGIGSKPGHWQGHDASETYRGESLFDSSHVWCFTENPGVRWLVGSALQSLPVLSQDLLPSHISVSVSFILFLQGHKPYWIKSPPYSSMTLQELITSAKTL